MKDFGHPLNKSPNNQNSGTRTNKQSKKLHSPKLAMKHTSKTNKKSFSNISALKAMGPPNNGTTQIFKALQGPELYSLGTNKGGMADITTFNQPKHKSLLVLLHPVLEVIILKITVEADLN